MEPVSQRLYRFDDKEIATTDVLMNAIRSMTDKPEYQSEWLEELAENGLTPEEYPLDAFVALCMHTDDSLRFDTQGTLVIL